MSPPGSRAAFDSFSEIATVRIELRDTDPVIWPQVEVPTSITLKVLHDIIQAAMGWFDCHVWEFAIDKRRYGLPMDEDWGIEPRTNAPPSLFLTAGRSPISSNIPLFDRKRPFDPCALAAPVNLIYKALAVRTVLPWAMPDAKEA